MSNGFTLHLFCGKILQQLKKLAYRMWRNTQEAEGAPLLRVQYGIPQRGFKSLFLRQCRSHSKMRPTYFCFRDIAGIIFPTQIIEAPPPTNWMTQKRDKYGNWTKQIFLELRFLFFLHLSRKTSNVYNKQNGLVPPCFEG